MAKMVDEITVPMARASILWLIGEYSERVPKIAPDVLRKMAKSFIDEVNIIGCVLSFCSHNFSTVCSQDVRCEKTLNSSFAYNMCDQMKPFVKIFYVKLFFGIGFY